MESSNLYHHQLQEQFVGNGLSSLHDWNPSISIDEDENYKRHLYGSEFPMWSLSADVTPAAASNFKSPVQRQYHQSPNNVVLQHENIEQPGISMLSHSLPVNADYVKREQHNLFDLNQNVFLGSGGGQFSARFGGMDSSPPSSLVSSISSCSKSAADGFTYTDSGDIISCNQFPSNTSRFGIGNIHEAIPSPSSSSTKATVKNEVLRVKRLWTTPSHQEQPKKPRTGSQRPSYPVLKVGKEKLGDRIAALHRLVAPFGKTDTASVLAEAIGYIQFLHGQIQALSMPYMKSSGARSHPHRTSRGQASDMKREDDKAAPDLKSRGLCLAPLSLISYISSCQTIYLSRAN